MKKIILPAVAALLILASCGGQKSDFKVPEEAPADSGSLTGNVTPGQYDPNKGIGRYTAENLQLSPYLNIKMAENGERIYKSKCLNCHSSGKDTITGPGFSGITKSRTPHWLMNYIINPHPMISEDIRLKQQAEATNTIMPDLALKDEEARDMLEYFRKINGVNPR